MSRILYDLCAADDQRFSPFCWRTKLALGHKGLTFSTEPVRFTEKHKIAFTQQDKVPVLDDGGTIVFDSWSIAEYLEETYPEAPSLFPGANGRQMAKQTAEWMDGLHRDLLSMVIFDIYGRLEWEDQAYFRPTREARYGMPLEDVQAGRDERVGEFREIALASLRVHVSEQPFICGNVPAYSDYAVFGSMQWARLVSDFDILAAGDPVFDWRARMLDRLDAMNLSGPAAPAT